MKEWGRVKGVLSSVRGIRARVGDRRPWMIGWVAVRGGCSHQRSRGCEGREAGQARLPRHVFALVVCMMGPLATARLGSISQSTAVWVMPIVELAAWSCPSLTLRRRARDIGSRRRAGRSRRA
jgi:hypothetical protein